MTKATTRRARGRSEATVWIDHDQAVIVDRESNQTETVDILSRGMHESEASFERRAVGELSGEDRVVVTGPAYARTQFERAYVALTHRPDRLVDVEPHPVPTPRPKTCRVF
jgi:hypothetical protein